MNTNIELLKQLRSTTGAGVMECRKALEHGCQDYERALAYLQESAAIKARSHAERQTQHGRIEVYAHNNGRIGVILEINTETEFASRSVGFHDFVHEIALQITSESPLYVRDEDIPAHILGEQSQAAAEKARLVGKPERIAAQIAAGAVEKYMNQNVLLRQAYIRDESMTIAQLLSQAAGRLGENIVIRRFARWEISPDVDTSQTV